MPDPLLPSEPDTPAPPDVMPPDALPSVSAAASPSPTVGGSGGGAPAVVTGDFRPETDLSGVAAAVEALRDEVGALIVGQHALVDELIAALLAGGHVLIEGVPGVAKTLTARLLARATGLDYSRIQFTPDMMPADVLGTSVFSPATGTFEFHRGPIFAAAILIDEINRAPAKTQAALFEVMEERQVTLDGVTYPMADPFVVFATQNPIEHEGTYRLPEAQLDRFLFKVRVGYPSLDEEVTLLERVQAHGGRLDDIARAAGARRRAGAGGAGGGAGGAGRDRDAALRRLDRRGHARPRGAVHGRQPARLARAPRRRQGRRRHERTRFRDARRRAHGRRPGPPPPRRADAGEGDRGRARGVGAAADRRGHGGAAVMRRDGCGRCPCHCERSAAISYRSAPEDQIATSLRSSQ